MTTVAHREDLADIDSWINEVNERLAYETTAIREIAAAPTTAAADSGYLMDVASVLHGAYVLLGAAREDLRNKVEDLEDRECEEEE